MLYYVYKTGSTCNPNAEELRQIRFFLFFLRVCLSFLFTFVSETPEGCQSWIFFIQLIFRKVQHLFMSYIQHDRH